MRKALIIIEGPSDKGFVEEIAKRLNVMSKVIIMRGNRPDKIARYVRAYHKDYDKIIILKDLHRHNESVIDDLTVRVRQIFRQVPEALDKLRIIKVRRALEAWFLADSRALGEVFDCRVNVDVGNPEALEDPAEYLNEKLRRTCGKEYVKNEMISREFARVMDVEAVMRKSSSFRDFVRALEDP